MEVGDARKRRVEAVESLRQDARVRAWRTCLQGLTFDVAAAAALVLLTVFSKASSWGDIQWTLLGFTLTKTITVSALSYLMRTVFADRFPVEPRS